MYGDLPYLLMDVAYNLMRSRESWTWPGLLMYSSVVCRAMAWPMKSRVVASRPNLSYTSFMVEFWMSMPSVFQLWCLLAPTTLPTLVRCRVVQLVLSNPLEERPSPAFLKQSHERGCKSLLGSGGHLGHGCLGALPLLHITASNLLEL